MSFEQLMEDTKKQASDNNVTMILSDEETLDYGDGTRVNGYFQGDSEKLEFAVAMGKDEKEWLPVFIHESCHMDQFLENAKVWTDLDSVSGDEDAITVLFNWIGGEDYPMELVKEAATLTMLMELDCEKRSVEKMKKYNLNINLEDYIKMCNCYVLFYKYILNRRTWYAPGKSPFHNEKVWSIFPSTFDIDYTKELSQEYIDAYDLSYL
jgi:hypothetical protein